MKGHSVLKNVVESKYDWKINVKESKYDWKIKVVSKVLHI